MPRALQAKQAREIDRKATLCELSLYHRLFLVLTHLDYSKAYGPMGRISSNQDGPQSRSVSNNPFISKENI